MAVKDPSLKSAEPCKKGAQVSNILKWLVKLQHTEHFSIILRLFTLGLTMHQHYRY
jgi:hypothetical protein